MFPIKFQPAPFQFLLYTEWILLGSCGSLAIVEAFEHQGIPVQHLLILLLLWVMGFRLPVGSRAIKLLYTSIEIGLIFYGALMGYLHILPMLYLIVVIRSCFLFDAPGRWTIAGTIFFLFLLHQISYVRNIAQLIDAEYKQQFWTHLIGGTLMFGLGLFLVLKLATALLSERKIQAELTTAHQQLQQFSEQEKYLATAQERNRIARNLHDSLGHALTAMNVQLQAAVELWKQDRTSERVEPFLAESQRLGLTAMREVRQSVSLLREEAQPEKPLAETIADLVESFQQGTGIATKFSVEGQSLIPASISYTLYRVVQETLTNISRHAQAKVVEVELTTHPDVVLIKVADDGRGFHRNGASQPSSQASFGMKGMKERIAVLGGKLEVTTEPGSGCQVQIEVPL